MGERTPPMLPDEVRKAVERMDGSLGDWGICRDAWAAVRAHLLAREAEVGRLQAIERERWDVVATRNAAVMRAERAEALLREIKEWDVGSLQDRKTLFALPLAIRQRITAHLSENSRG